jgi:hypothetical protein
MLFLIMADILLSQAQGVTVGKAQRKPLKQGKQVSRQHSSQAHCSKIFRFSELEAIASLLSTVLECPEWHGSSITLVDSLHESQEA